MIAGSVGGHVLFGWPVHVRMLSHLKIMFRRSSTREMNKATMARKLLNRILTEIHAFGGEIMTVTIYRMKSLYEKSAFQYFIL